MKRVLECGLGQFSNKILASHTSLAPDTNDEFPMLFHCSRMCPRIGARGSPPSLQNAKT